MFGRRRFPIGRRRGRRGRGTNPFIILMAMRLLQQINRLPVKPPVTLGLMGLQTALHLSPMNLPFSIYGLSPQMIWERSEFSRLISGQLLHADDYHLYYNMASFLYKGVKLETSISSNEFAIMTGVLMIGTGIIHTMLAVLLYTTYPEAYFTTAVGFSGVIFALKTVLNFNSPTMTNVWGINLPTKHAAWLELIIISFLNPNSSFLGHLSGILAGLIWLEFKENRCVSTWIRNLLSSRGISVPNIFTNNSNSSSPRVDREEEEIREAIRRSREEADRRSREEETARRREQQEMRARHFEQVSQTRSSHQQSSPSTTTSSSSTTTTTTLTAEQLRSARLRRFNKQ